MRLTKKDSLRDTFIKTNKKSINRDSNILNDKGIYFQKFLKTSTDYRVINNKIIIDPNNIKNYDDNTQNILLSEENRKKPINYIISTEKNRERYKKIKLNRINHKSYNYKYNNFISEQNSINDSKPCYINTEYIKEENNYIDRYYMKNNLIKNEKSIKIESFDKIKNNLFNNKLTELNNNNLNNKTYIYKKQNEFLSKEIKPNEKTINSEYSFNNIENNLNKKNDKKKKINRRLEFLKKLNLINIDEQKNENIINNNHSLENKNFEDNMQSPKTSILRRQYSPFKDILSKSNNGFYINRMPYNETDINNKN